MNKDTREAALVRPLSDLGRADLAVVGGKNASLGEMIGKLKDAGIKVPDGFATTASAYWQFLDANTLREPIAAKLGELAEDAHNLAAVGKAVREMILAAQFPAELSAAISRSYRKMGRRAVAVRSSATAEDLPEASFAGQLETFLNVRGERALLDACKRCFASLFTDRAIAAAGPARSCGGIRRAARRRVRPPAKFRLISALAARRTPATRRRAQD